MRVTVLALIGLAVLSVIGVFGFAYAMTGVVLDGIARFP